MRKKVLVVAMAMLMAANGVNAKGGEVITGTINLVGYANTTGQIATLAISSAGKATVNGMIRGTSTVTKIEMKVRLQKYSSSEKAWKNIKTWSVTKNNNSAQYSGTYQLTNSGKYRTKVKGTVYTKSSSEEVSATSAAKNY